MGEANGRTKSMYTVYVLKSAKDGNLYIGCTSNLGKRLDAHKDGKVRSTKSRRPLKLTYSEECADRHEAYRAEKHYKTAKGKKIIRQKISTYCRVV